MAMMKSCYLEQEEFRFIHMKGFPRFAFPNINKNCFISWFVYRAIRNLSSFVIVSLSPVLNLDYHCLKHTFVLHFQARVFCHRQPIAVRLICTHWTGINYHRLLFIDFTFYLVICSILSSEVTCKQ